MKALVYHGPGRCGLEDRPRPRLEAATDALVRVCKTTICGADLRILRGGVPGVTGGRVLGREGVGIVEEIGAGVTGFAVGDHVLISCVTSCTRCSNCKRGLNSHCEGSDWILGHTIDGTQAEYVKIPFADESLHAIPPGADEEALVLLSDVLPAGYECAVLNGHVQPGDTVAIVGAGPVGLAALLTAQFFSPSQLIMVDVDENRLEAARKLGATHLVNGTDGDAIAQVMHLTQNRGVDVAMEAVGISASFNICQRIVAAGGHLANIGGHGQPVQLDLDKLWSHNISLNTRLVDTITTPLLLKIALAGKLAPCQRTTHHFSLCDIVAAYGTLGRARQERALKVIISTDDLAPRNATTLEAVQAWQNEGDPN